MLARDVAPALVVALPGAGRVVRAVRGDEAGEDGAFGPVPGEAGRDRAHSVHPRRAPGRVLSEQVLHVDAQVCGPTRERAVGKLVGFVHAARTGIPQKGVRPAAPGARSVPSCSRIFPRGLNLRGAQGTLLQLKGWILARILQPQVYSRVAARPLRSRRCHVQTDCQDTKRGKPPFSSRLRRGQHHPRRACRGVPARDHREGDGDGGRCVVGQAKAELGRVRARLQRGAAAGAARGGSLRRRLAGRLPRITAVGRTREAPRRWGGFQAKCDRGVGLRPASRPRRRRPRR